MLGKAWLLVAIAMLTDPASAGVHHVPADYATINQALDAASAGDTVRVSPGTYSQYETRQIANGAWISSVAFLKAGVVLDSEMGAKQTILRMDATTGFPRVAWFDHTPGDIAVSGITISGGAAGLQGLTLWQTGKGVIRDCVFEVIGAGNGDGGALSIAEADLDLSRCVFRTIDGGPGSAINQTNGIVLIEDCLFENCRSGAIQLNEDDLPHPTGATIRRSVFRGNVKTTGGGGAIATRDYATVLIEDCWFEENQSLMSSASGGALSLNGFTSNQVVRRNTFVRNFTGPVGSGGAIYVHCWTCDISENTFVASGRGVNTSLGGACLFVEGGTVTIRRNVIADSYGDSAIGRFGGTIVLGCNVFWSNAVGNAEGFSLDPTDVIADPMFCHPEDDDFSIDGDSPCMPEHSSGCELIGAWPQGCGGIAVVPESWGRLKERFRAGS